MSSRFSRNHEDMFPRYYMHSDVYVEGKTRQLHTRVSSATKGSRHTWEGDVFASMLSSLDRIPGIPHGIPHVH